MDNCASTNIYEDLEFCKGKTVLPGLRPEIYAIPKSAILVYPTLPDIDSKDASMASIATYLGDFKLDADAYFNKIDILTPASSIKSESQGEKPSKTFINTLTAKYADVSEKATGFCRMANSDDLLYVVRQRDGRYRVIGNESFETETNPAQDSGMNVTDASGTTLEISVTDVCPAPYYYGLLKTRDGYIDCATGNLLSPDEVKENEKDPQNE